MSDNLAATPKRTWRSVVMFLCLLPFFVLGVLAAVVWLGLEFGYAWGELHVSHAQGEKTMTELTEDIRKRSSC